MHKFLRIFHNVFERIEIPFGTVSCGPKEPCSLLDGVKVGGIHSQA